MFTCTQLFNGSMQAAIGLMFQLGPQASIQCCGLLPFYRHHASSPALSQLLRPASPLRTSTCHPRPCFPPSPLVVPNLAPTPSRPRTNPLPLTVPLLHRHPHSSVRLPLCRAFLSNLSPLLAPQSPLLLPLT